MRLSRGGVKTWRSACETFGPKRVARNGKARYGSVVRKLPSYILTNGLGQTLAFLKAKGKGEPGNEHEVLYRHLADWVGRKVNADGDLLSWLVNTATSQQYRLATMEALALLQWLKRFAEAELPKGREE
jgi:CRISPR-associated protein Cmr5